MEKNTQSEETFVGNGCFRCWDKTVLVFLKNRQLLICFEDLLNSEVLLLEFLY